MRKEYGRIDYKPVLKCWRVVLYTGDYSETELTFNHPSLESATERLRKAVDTREVCGSKI